MDIKDRGVPRPLAEINPDCTREQVRRLATIYSDNMHAAARNGHNPHQISLDQQDEIRAHINKWPLEERVRFMNMYAEEMNALARNINAQTERITQGRIIQEFANQRAAVAGASLSGIIVALIIIYMIYSH